MNRSSNTTHPIQMKGTLTGVTRLSSKAKGAILLLGLLVLGFIAFSMINMDQNAHSIRSNNANGIDGRSNAERRAVQPAQPAFEKMFGHVSSGGRSTAQEAPSSMALSNDLKQKQTLMAPLPSGVVFEKLSDKRGHTRQKEDRRQQSAIRAALEMRIGGRSAPVLNTDRAREFSDTDRLRRAQSDRIASALDAAAQAVRAAQNPSPPLDAASILHDADPNQQGHKKQFLHSKSALPKTYLKAKKQLPVSPFEIKAGWVIPAALECGLNSDLPGQTCARVTENVYDTATGLIMLIPQGTKVIGTYDSQIAYGQQRILVVWNRLIFPDASSISLNGMPGTDKAGYAGFDADVDRHTLSVFGNAILMAIFSAGIERTQQRNISSDRALNNDVQSISQSLGQQLGRTGTAMIRRGMNVQPTLTRPPGYTFNIIATRDIVFPGAYHP